MKNDVKDRIKAETDIIRLVESYGVQLQKAGKEFKGLCPFHQDSKTLENVSVSNIIIQYTPIEKIEGDKQGKLEVNIIGEGVAKVFYGGQYFLAKWIKKSKEQPTLYYDAYGNLLKLNKGKTWIQVVSNDTNVWIK